MTEKLYKITKNDPVFGSWPFGLTSSYFDTLEEAEAYAMRAYPKQSVNILKYNKITHRWKKYKTIGPECKSSNNMQVFLEHNVERLQELAKRAGQDREKYLIGIINQLTEERNELRDHIQQVAQNLVRVTM